MTGHGAVFNRCWSLADRDDIFDLPANTGWFDWESEGYPHWANLRHVQTWWNYKHLPNILLVHFNDLLADLEREIARIASYLEIECAPAKLKAIAEMVKFKSMKRDAEKLEPNAHLRFKGGAQTFINKGTTFETQMGIGRTSVTSRPGGITNTCQTSCWCTSTTF